MGDIDFDELDKAVNSLMGSADVPREAAASSAQQRSKSISQFVRPSRPDTVPNSDVSQKPKTLAVRRTGRFMDVVDSSSDLNPLRKPLAMPSREAARMSPTAVPSSMTNTSEPSFGSVALDTNIAPVSENSNESTPVDTAPQAPEVTSGNADNSAGHAIKVNLGNKDTSSFPDPIDLMQMSSPEQDDSQDVRPVAVFGEPSSVVTPSEEIVDTSTQDDTTSSFSVKVTNHTAAAQTTDDMSVSQEAGMPNVDDESVVVPQQPDISLPSDDLKTPVPVVENDSPFIVNAKIEKRPLNADPLAATEPDALLQSIDNLMQSTQLPTQENNNSSFNDTIAPEIAPYEQQNISEVPELSNELVKIEATGKASVPQEEAVAQEPNSVVAAEAAAVAPIAELDAPAGPSSIPQQYQAQESSGDTSHAPIYDANELAVPVTHPAKKKSGWLLVLAVLILLALGSGGAVVLYLTGIIP